jgi:hypothetical protein
MRMKIILFLKFNKKTFSKYNHQDEELIGILKNESKVE